MARWMISTDSFSLPSCSSVACPPSENSAVRYPVLPRLRVGIALGVALFSGSGGIACAVGCVSRLCAA